MIYKYFEQDFFDSFLCYSIITFSAKNNSDDHLE